MLKFQNLTHRYDQRGTQGVFQVSLELQTNGKSYALLGHSGSGKSTLLRLIENETKSICSALHIELDDNKSLLDLGIAQLNSQEDLSEEKKINLVRSSLSDFDCEHLVESKLKELSAGEHARALMALRLLTKPKLILLDEPLAHLDERLRQTLMKDFIKHCKEQAISVLWASHDTKLALSLSDQIIILEAGECVFQGTPKECYDHSHHIPEVASLFGPYYTIQAKVLKEEEDKVYIHCFDQDIMIEKNASFCRFMNDFILISFRPEDCVIHAQDSHDKRKDVDNPYLKVALEHVEYLGQMQHWYLDVCGHKKLSSYVYPHQALFHQSKLHQYYYLEIVRPTFHESF